jgi:hypothetical protein
MSPTRLRLGDLINSKEQVRWRDMQRLVFLELGTLEPCLLLAVLMGCMDFIRVYSPAIFLRLVSHPLRYKYRHAHPSLRHSEPTDRETVHELPPYNVEARNKGAHEEALPMAYFIQTALLEEKPQWAPSLHHPKSNRYAYHGDKNAIL